MTGKKIDSKVMASRDGLIVRVMKATTNMERNTVSELSSGLMDHLTSENFIIIIFTAKVFTHGQIIENTRVNGGPIKCTAKVHLLGLTGGNM